MPHGDTRPHNASDPDPLDLDADAIDRLAGGSPPMTPAPPLTRGQVALRLAGLGSGLGFFGGALVGAWPLALGALFTAGVLMFVWMGHEPIAHRRLTHRTRDALGLRLSEHGFASAASGQWQRADPRESVRWLGFGDPHAESLAPAALAGRVPVPGSRLALQARFDDGLPDGAVLEQADDRTGLPTEWADHLVTTGDAGFDARFTLRGPPRPLLALLDGDLRDRLVGLDDGERILRIDRVALAAIDALGRSGDSSTAAFLEARAADQRQRGVIARRDALDEALKAIRHRGRRARDVREAALGGGLAVARSTEIDGGLSPAAGGELSPSEATDGR